MFLFSVMSTYLALLIFLPAISIWSNLGIAVVTALAATFIEAVSPWGLDNLTIPAISGLILYAFLGG